MQHLIHIYNAINTSTITITISNSLLLSIVWTSACPQKGELSLLYHAGQNAWYNGLFQVYNLFAVLLSCGVFLLHHHQQPSCTTHHPAWHVDVLHDVCPDAVYSPELFYISGFLLFVPLVSPNNSRGINGGGNTLYF